jgi:hypothetical protein
METKGVVAAAAAAPVKKDLLELDIVLVPLRVRNDRFESEYFTGNLRRLNATVRSGFRELTGAPDRREEKSYR